MYIITLFYGSEEDFSFVMKLTLAPSNIKCERNMIALSGLGLGNCCKLSYVLLLEYMLVCLCFSLSFSFPFVF